MERRSSDRRAAERRSLERRTATNPAMGEFYIAGLRDGVMVYGLNKRRGERRHTERRMTERRAEAPPINIATRSAISLETR